MKAQLKYLRYVVKESFWFIPATMLIAGIAAALLMPLLDAQLKATPLDWLQDIGRDGARSILGTIAGAMATVASLVFSLTMIALTLASQQLGPRLLTTLISDRATQHALGAFVATFVYALLAMRSFGDGNDQVELPLYTLSLGMLLALAAMGVLIAFIHNIAQSIQADALIARVADQLDRAIADNFPERKEGEKAEDEPRHGAGQELDEEDENVHRLLARRTGYVQVIEPASLVPLARRHDLCVELKCWPGSFVVEGSPLALVAGSWEEAREKADGELREAIVIGPRRTPAQDVEFSFNALVEVATRALSPGINDHYTALTCIDRLSAALTQVLMRRLPPAEFRDQDDVLRLSFKPLSLESLLTVAFDDIRVSARGLPIILVSMLNALDRLIAFAPDRKALELIHRHVDKVGRAGELETTQAEDRVEIRDRWGEIDRRLGGSGSPWKQGRAA